MSDAPTMTNEDEARELRKVLIRIYGVDQYTKMLNARYAEKHGIKPQAQKEYSDVKSQAL